MREVARNRRFQRLETGKCATANAPRREPREEPLDLIQPTRTGRGEVHVIARMPGKPPRHFRRPVRTVVVHDDVDLARRRHLRVELPRNLRSS